MSSQIRQVASDIAATLQRSGIADSALEAEVLLRHVLEHDRARFYASLQDTIGVEDFERVQELTRRRIAREPLAYITGHREFYGLDFLVSPGVLIPRQETEQVVERALKVANERHDHDKDISVADVGTGSGAIAVTIAANLPGARVFAIDCSAEALAIASRNCQRHRVANRVTLLQGDLLAPLSQAVDLIVSNPPYIATNLLSGLAPEVQCEPQMALDGGEDGLEIIRRLFQQATSKLNEGGQLVVEISPEQLISVKSIAQENFPQASITHINDLLRLPRCVIVAT